MKLYLNLFLLLLASFSSFAQIEGAKTKIAAIGRFTTANGIELRWIPDHKTILRLGFNHSYTLQRKEAGANKFEDIATVKASDQATWNSLIATEKNLATKDNMEIAMEFLFAGKDNEQKALNLDAGIADLKEQKSKEDMIYSLFVLTTIKDGKVAKALGLSYIDNAVKLGQTYAYQIKLNANSTVYEIENANITVKAVADANRYKNEVLVFAGDTKLSFAWPVNPEIAGYFVERAAEGETQFKPLNTVPIYDSKGAGFEGKTNGTFDDDSLTNYKWYRYRFYGLTSFGEKVLFAEAKGMPKDLTPPDAPILKQLKHVKPKEIRIGWDIYGNKTDLKGFMVARSSKDSGDFKLLHQKLLANTIRSFVDTDFNLEENNYYVVYALDTAGNISASYPGYVALVDTIPPSKPEIVSAIVDSLGVVTLTIKKGKEKDLKGYRIYKSNSAEHELSVIQESFRKDKLDSNAVKLVFTDTVSLNSLTPKTYYQVKALDFNYNQSIYSDVIAVKRPDTIPPITPVFTNVIVKEKQIELYFAPSESLDVKEQLIYRKTNLNNNWEVVFKLSPLQKKVIDTAVKTNITYYYSIRAVDQSKLYSKYANPVYGKPFDGGIRPPVTNINSNIINKEVELKWTYPQLKKEVFFVIYKKNAKGELQQYARVTDKKFTDKNMGKENIYAIKVLTEDGGQSPLSEFIIQKAQ
ncbi:hypothetical protein WG904_16215 [Pedobacter sp. Du54]|uniref:hypothetical protein n=1 Tax=Pedobacter anseongensis TaxID=3133439 RepID=UPI0030B05D7B